MRVWLFQLQSRYSVAEFVRIRGALLLGVVVALFYCAWRVPLPLVWDDTSQASYESQLVNTAQSTREIARKPSLARECFDRVAGGGYRPVSMLLTLWGARHTPAPDAVPVVLYLISSVAFGLLAALLFVTCELFLRSKRWALLGTLLYLLSMPVWTAGLVIFAGLQVLVPLLILSALWCYLLGSRDPLVAVPAENRPVSSLARFGWAAALCVILVMGPWVREFVGLAALLILVREFQRRRVSGWGVLACLGLIHALYPTAVMRLVFPELPLAPVFSLGNLGQIVKPLPRHISPGTVIRAVQALHWRIFADLFSLVPPLLMLLATGGWMWSLRRTTDSDNTSRGDKRWLFVWAFFLLAFLPFLKVFKLHVHLTYALVPLALLVAEGLRRLTQRLPERRDVRIMFALALALGMADQALSPWVVSAATSRLYAAVERQAARLQTVAPKGTPVLCNALQIEDIRYYSRGHITVWALAGGTPNPGDAVTTTSQLASRLAARGSAPALCLDVAAPALAGQHAAGRQNYIVCESLVGLKPLSPTEQVRVRWPILDPLKFFVPTRSHAWPGPPDLEFDGYRGPALNGNPLMRELALDYRLYRITGREVARWEPFPLLLEEYLGFNIVAYGRSYYAVREKDGAFTAERWSQRRYRDGSAHVSVDAARQQIERIALPLQSAHTSR